MTKKIVSQKKSSTPMAKKSPPQKKGSPCRVKKSMTQDEDHPRQVKKNTSQKKDFSRILPTELRKRMKQGIKQPPYNIPRTIQINKVKKVSDLTIKNYQFIQIFLNTKRSQVVKSLLKLLSVPGYAIKYK